MFLRCAVVDRTALETIDRLTDTLDLTEYASRIIHPLVRTLDTCSELRPIAMDTLTSLVLQLNKKYEIFIPMVSRVIKRHRIVHQRHDIVLSRIQVRAGWSAGCGCVFMGYKCVLSCVHVHVHALAKVLSYHNLVEAVRIARSELLASSTYLHVHC